MSSEGSISQVLRSGRKLMTGDVKKTDENLKSRDNLDMGSDISKREKSKKSTITFLRILTKIPVHRKNYHARHLESTKNSVLLKIVPVTLEGPNGTIETCALCDEASTITIIEEEIANVLGCVGEKKPLTMKGTDDTIKKEKRKQERKTVSGLLPEEIDIAEKKWIKIAQKEDFESEIEDMRKLKKVTKESRLYQLTPYLDEENIIRMSGRLKHAPNLDDNYKNPIILHPKNELTKLLINFYHEKNFHQGQETVVNMLREKYWILCETLLKRIGLI
ncbi:hypothetical protein JTB14_016271 [Gonioctena quinquepunctata]|nr:hypothetical protein JTB14_016271 [Gonioctena quinquepunctata]